MGYLFADGMQKAEVVGSILVNRAIGFLVVLIMATIALQFVPNSLAQTEHSWSISLYIYISATIIGLSIIIAVMAVIKDRKLALALWLLLFGLLFPIII